MRETKHPGEFLHQYLIERKRATVESVAATMNLETFSLQAFIDGRFRVDADFARKLHSATGVSEAFWLNMQSKYDKSRESR